MLNPDRSAVYDRLKGQVGHTPLHEVRGIEIPSGNRILAKEEWRNPTASIFDRVYPHLFEIAENEGLILPGITPVIEASAGNAGASFAWCARELGYHDCTVVLPSDAPSARRQQIISLGAKVVESPAGQYTKGYVHKLEMLLRDDKRLKGGTIGTNPSRLYCVTKINPRAREVYASFVAEVLASVDAVDCFVGVVGSGTSISGIGRYLKERNPRTMVIAVDPEESPTTRSLKYDGRMLDFERMPHNIFGGATFGLPAKKLNIDLGIIDSVQLVSRAERERAQRLLSDAEGEFVGRTSACALAGALLTAADLEKSTILTCFYDPSWKCEDGGRP